MRQILSMVFISVCCVCVDQEAPQEAEVLYEDAVLFFDETRKWRDRYLVVRANYCLECHDSLEVSATTRIDYTLPELSFTASVLLLLSRQTFVKGVPPRQKLLPTGGAVLTTEEKYMSMVDKCFPDDTSK